MEKITASNVEEEAVEGKLYTFRYVVLDESGQRVEVMRYHMNSHDEFGNGLLESDFKLIREQLAKEFDLVGRLTDHGLVLGRA